jgi:hypothetical protein
VCIWDDRDGYWKYSPGEYMERLVCRMDHPIKDTLYGDRGEFGMPAVGGSMSGLDHLIDDDARYKQSLRDAASGADEFTGKVDFIDPYKMSPGKVWAMPVGDNWTCTITEDGVSVEYGPTGHGANAVTEDAKYILSCLPELLIHFLHKNAKYARAQTHDLGAKGVIPDINRKVSALITYFWDNDGDGELPGDTPEGLIDDTIGHLLLLRAKVRDS